MEPGDQAGEAGDEGGRDPGGVGPGKAGAQGGNREEVEAPAPTAVRAQLPYEDIRAALSFLERAFGFREIPTARFVGADGELLHATVEFGNSLIGVGGQGHHGAISPMSGGVESQFISVHVDDIDAHYQRAVAAGARIADELRDHSWGERTYWALDLEGHRWRFGQPLREVPQSGRRRRPGTH